MNGSHKLRPTELAAIALLAVITVALYWPVRNYEFVNYDDPPYVYENAIVLRGLTKAGIVWAFSNLAGEHTYWHPLTWMSHMVDCQLFGRYAGAHHLVNVLFHAANAILLLLALKKLTGAFWPSAMVAALFAWHPLQVDSVAWISERKNMLSTLFWLLTILAYARYARVPSAARYVVMLVCFGLGLMAKPMLVTVPLILLLLDFWPLGRIRTDKTATRCWTAGSPTISAMRAILEKTPLFALSAISAAITVLGHLRLKALAATDQLPMSDRIGNALVSYARYIARTIWPANLSVLYPHPGKWPVWEVAGAALFLAGVTAWTFWARRGRPYLLTGWLWFLIALAPVIGVIQASNQSMADRFAYVPAIGLFTLLVWLAAGVGPGWSCRTIVLRAMAGATLAACLTTARLQLRHWQNSEALFRHALRVTEGNDIMHYNLACALAQQHRLDEAVTEFQTCLRLNPARVAAHDNLGVVFEMQGKLSLAHAEFEEAVRGDPKSVSARNNFGLALQEQGKIPEAIAQFEEALRIEAGNSGAHNNLGRALTAQGKTNEALAEFKQALRLQPEYADAHYNLGQLYFAQGNADEAAHQYATAVQNRPDYAEAHYQLAALLASQRDFEEAIPHYRAAVRLKPDWLEALNNLAWILATQPDKNLRDGEGAVRLSVRAVELTKTNNAGALDTLAASYAEAGRFPEAIRTARQAVDTATASNQKELTAQLLARLALYESGRPFRE